MREITDLAPAAQTALAEIKDLYEPQAILWNTEVVSYMEENKRNLSTPDDAATIVDILMENLVIHHKIITKVGTTLVDTLFTAMPNWMIVRMAGGAFKQILETDAALAARFLADLSFPLENAPLIPRSVKDLQRLVLEHLQELLDSHEFPTPEEEDTMTEAEANDDGSIGPH